VSEPEEKPIRVVDRRLFTREGDLRPGVEAEEAPSETRSPLAPSAAAPSPAPSETPPAAAPPPDASPSGEAGADAGPAASSEFLFLIQFLYSNALAALGVDPVTGAALPRRDLAFGRRVIDALAALEFKTRGNLSFEETNLLSQVLYQLRMDYVDATRGPSGAPQGPPPPGPGKR
jgi:hypothetical protein